MGRSNRRVTWWIVCVAAPCVVVAIWCWGAASQPEFWAVRHTRAGGRLLAAGHGVCIDSFGFQVAFWKGDYSARDSRPSQSRWTSLHYASARVWVKTGRFADGGRFDDAGIARSVFDPVFFSGQYRHVYIREADITQLEIPHLVPLLLAAMPLALKLARWLAAQRKRQAGLCPKCRYDLRGSPGPACPECGEPIAVVSSSGGKA